MNSEEGICTAEQSLALRKTLNQAILKCTRKLKKQEEEFEESRKSLWYKQIGDTLLTSSEPISKGTSKVTLVNIHTQIEESFAINPKMDLKENAQLFFKKAKKGKRGEQISERKVDCTREELTQLRSIEAEISELFNQNKDIKKSIIDNFENRLMSIVTSSPKNKKTNLGHQKQKTPYRYYSIEGWDIYIGKNNVQNDELSTRFASPEDIWLHVAAHAGSHVVIKRPKGAPFPPPQILEVAASLSVWFSKAKHTSYAEVNYTEARFVRKRRHAPAGEVIAERCKNMRTSPRSPHEIFPSEMYQDEA